MKGVNQPDKRTPAHDAKDESVEREHIGDTMVDHKGARHHHQPGVLTGEDQGGVPFDGDHPYTSK